MSETELFLSLLVDDDGIVTSQNAQTPGEVQLAVCAAPSTVSYITCGTGSNVSVDALPISDLAAANLDLTGKTVTTSNLVVKADLTVQGTACPIPLPFGYMQLDADDVASSDEKALGYSNTPTTIVSDTDDVEWDDAAKNFIVKKAGTYEVLGIVILEGGSSLVNLNINLEGTPVLTGAPRVHSSVDPLEHTIRAIFVAAADDVINITYEATAATTVKAIEGSSMSLGRKK